VSVRAYLPPHNFTVSWLCIKSLHWRFEVIWLSESTQEMVG